MSKKKKKVQWVLSVDLKNGDGAELFPIGGRYWKKNMANIEAGFVPLLFCCVPPPKVEVVAIPEKAWKKIVKAGGRDR